MTAQQADPSPFRPLQAGSGSLRRRILAPLAALAIGLTAATTISTATPQPASAAATQTVSKPGIFAYYYLWWSRSHWNDLLGAKYPSTSAVLPLPARLDAAGCNPVTNYPGNQLTDVPQTLYSQDDPGFIEADVRQAAAAGLTGFAANWIGTGSTTQTATSNPYSKRLKILVDAVHKVNSEGIPFKLWLSYKASASVKNIGFIANDLTYLNKAYGADSAFDRSLSSKMTVIWQGSRKYPTSELSSISATFRSTLRILGDETTWSSARAPYLDGNAYYWSSQNLYTNPQSFKQLASLAAAVRASGPNPDGSAKAWVAPITPGYDKQLSGGSSCVPRHNGQTLINLYNGNSATKPDAYGLISWNEIAEGTYIDPMTRYGNQDLNSVRSLTGR